MPLTETLTRKVGPLPAWGWGVVVVGGYLAYRFIGGGGGNGTTAAGVPSVGAPSDSGGGGGGGSSGGQQAVLDALAGIRTAIAAIPGPGSAGGGSSGGGGSGSAGSGGTGGGTGGGAASGATIVMPWPASDGEIASIISAYSPTTWGAPISLTAPSGDTYTLAQQYAYAILHPELIQSGTLFAKTDTGLRDQLYGLITSLVASVETRQGYTTEIPQWVLALAGVNRYTTSFVEQQYEQLGVNIAIAPEVTRGTTYADLAIAIPKLQSYIYNLQQVKNPTLAQQQSLATYKARLTDYQKQYSEMVYQPIALYSGTPPTISGGQFPSGGNDAPSTAAAPVDYTKAISTLQGYVTNLSAVRNPTQAQRDQLALYQQRIVTYAAR